MQAVRYRMWPQTKLLMKEQPVTFTVEQVVRAIAAPETARLWVNTQPATVTLGAWRTLRAPKYSPSLSANRQPYRLADDWRTVIAEPGEG